MTVKNDLKKVDCGEFKFTKKEVKEIENLNKDEFKYLIQFYKVSPRMWKTNLKHYEETYNIGDVLGIISGFIACEKTKTGLNFNEVRALFEKRVKPEWLTEADKMNKADLLADVKEIEEVNNNLFSTIVTALEINLSDFWFGEVFEWEKFNKRQLYTILQVESLINEFEELKKSISTFNTLKDDDKKSVLLSMGYDNILNDFHPSDFGTQLEYEFNNYVEDVDKEDFLKNLKGYIKENNKPYMVCMRNQDDGGREEEPFKGVYKDCCTYIKEVYEDLSTYDNVDIAEKTEDHHFLRGYGAHGEFTYFITEDEETKLNNFENSKKRLIEPHCETLEDLGLKPSDKECEEFNRDHPTAYTLYDFLVTDLEPEEIERLKNTSKKYAFFKNTSPMRNIEMTLTSNKQKRYKVVDEEEQALYKTSYLKSVIRACELINLKSYIFGGSEE